MKISHSALEDYAKCGELYRLKRLIKDNPEIVVIKKQPVYSLVLGTVVHDALERYYLKGTPVLEGLATYWQGELAASEAEHLLPKLQQIALDIGSLFERASAKYSGPDRIRTKGGSVSAKPQATDAWKQQAKELDLENRTTQVDQIIASRTPADSPWRELPFSQVFAESLWLLAGWKNPSIIKTTVDVEKAFNVEFPFNLPAKVYLTGKIDLICNTIDGKTMIVDHKTSGGDPPPDWKVAMNDQLLLYAFVHFITTGELVDYIAIHHIRSKRLIPARFEPELAEHVIMRHENALRGILADSFVKQNPTNYGASCVRDGNACPFLAYCHPKFFLQVS